MKGDVALVGVAESDLGEVGPGLTPLDLIAQATLRALDDAGLEKGDVDGLFSSSAYYFMPTLSIGEYLSIRYTVRKRFYPHGCCRKMSGIRPIEEAFEKVKGLLRKVAARSREALVEAMGTALAAIGCLKRTSPRVATGE